MTVRAYPAYRESGNDWLGHIPSEWKIVRFKHLFRERDERSATGEETLLSVSAYTGVRPRSEITEPGEYLSRAESLVDYKLACRNDLVINIMLAWNRALGVAGQGGIVSPAYCVFKPNKLVNPSFIHYALRSNEYVSCFRAHSTGVMDSRLRLYPDVFLSLSFFLPPQTEQSAIAAFLDRETGKIDALVAEQERLIALLKEKRQAVISHAVTKGLNPNASMKDSGVSWLGKVPAHWKGIQLGRVCRHVSDGPHFSPTYVESDEGVMFLSARNIQIDKWSLDDAKFVSVSDYNEFCKRIIPVKGDILYTKGGTTGIARVVDLDLKFQVWVHVAVLKLHNKIADPYFIAYALNSAAGYEQSQLHTRGATNQDLGLTRMVQIWLALPPLKEQQSVVSFLEDRTADLDHLSIEATRAITLLRERRAALISAAVIGKIDVRDMVAQPSSQAA